MTVFNELDQARDICEKCGANRNLVFEMAVEEIGSDNFEIAWKILANCKACKEEYRNLLWLCENIA